MKKAKKTVSLILAMAMILGIIVIAPTTASAAGGVQAKIDTVRAVYPNSCKYFTRSGNQCTNASGEDCKLQNIPARGGLPSGASVSSWGCYSCYAFAEYVFAYTFGKSFRNCPTAAKPVFGDVIRVVGWYGESHYGIYLGEDANYYYVFDGNGDGKCGVQYNHALSKSEHPLQQTYHASNYNDIDGEPTGQNPIGGIDGVSSPSPGKITVIGWAYDPDNTAAQIDVHIYVGGPSGSGEKHIIKANTYQKSVDDTYHCGLYHGFFATLDTKKTGNQPIYAYGINIGGGTANTQLYGVPRTVYINSDTEKPNVTDITVSQITSNGYRVSCKVSDNVGVTTVKFPSWEQHIGASDVKWHVGTLSSDKGIASCYIPLSEHNNVKGDYITHIYPYDECGNYCSVSAGNITITDEPILVGTNEYNGNTYKVFNSGKTWAEAKEWCEKQGGHLATIYDENEWKAVKGALEKFNGVPCWLGAESTSGTWKWVTGENLSYTNWSSGQPDCGSNVEHYLGTFDDTKKWLDCYSWNDYSSDGSSRIGGFVCEFEKEEIPTQPTTVKPTETTESTQPTTVKPTETTEPTEPKTTATEPTEVPSQPTEDIFHVVAGSPELCNGVEWDPASSLNLMTLDDDGVYRITYSNVPAGTYEFKVTTNGAWDNGEFNLVGNAMYGGSNAEITVTEDNSTVLISFKESDMHANAYINGVLVDVGATEPTEPTTVNPTEPTEPTPATEEKTDISKWQVSGIYNKQYTGKYIKQDGITVYNDGEYADIKVKYRNNLNAGTATVIITGTGDYTGTITKTFRIYKAVNPMVIWRDTETVSSKALKKRKVIVKGAIGAYDYQGAVTFTKHSGSKSLTISKGGVITVKKGKYKKNSILSMKVKVTVKGNANYMSKSKKMTVKIKIK